MKKTKAIIIIIFLSIMCLNIQMTPAYKEEDVFNDILEKTNSTVLEGGVNIFFESKNNDNDIDICIKLLKELGLYDKYNVKVVQNDNVYRLEFDFNYTKGFVQCIKDSNSMVFDIISTNNVDNLASLENKIITILEKKYKNIKHYRYLKAKLPNNNIESTERNVVGILNNKNSANINAIKINNGYSINAYTKKYEPVKSGDKLIDFHCIICNYSSGDYIILGTPEIRTTY